MEVIVFYFRNGNIHPSIRPSYFLSDKRIISSDSKKATTSKSGTILTIIRANNFTRRAVTHALIYSRWLEYYGRDISV